MKIVLIGPVYPYKGGIAHYTSMLCNALSKRHEVILISYKMQYPKLLIKREQKDYANDLFKIEDTKYWINTANPFNIISVARKINRMQPDIVLFQWWHPYFAPCYRIMANHINKTIKVFFTCHNVFPHERFPLDRFLTRLVLNKGDGFIVHSKSDEKDLLSIKTNVNRVFNPLPTFNVFKMKDLGMEQARKEIVEKDGFKITENTKLLLFFGFVREYKGLKHLLRAMPLIIEKEPDCRVMVVGTFDDDREQYNELIDELNVSKYVWVKDTYTPDNEVEKYFAACDLVVLPYENATQSGIVQIAYSFDKPCLVTNVGGLPDVVEDGVTGYIVKAFDSESISEAVVDYFSNNRGEKMKNNVISASEKYSWNHMVESIGRLVIGK